MRDLFNACLRYTSFPGMERRLGLCPIKDDADVSDGFVLSNLPFFNDWETAGRKTWDCSQTAKRSRKSIRIPKERIDNSDPDYEGMVIKSMDKYVLAILFDQGSFRPIMIADHMSPARGRLPKESIPSDYNEPRTNDGPC